jgi:hypothetical protein
MGATPEEIPVAEEFKMPEMPTTTNPPFEEVTFGTSWQ